MLLALVLGTLLEQGLGTQKVVLVLLTAHLIIFWLSQDSNVTPPVCLTAFAVATIAKTPPMRTGLTALKIAKDLYLVHLLMSYTSLVSRDWVEVVTIGSFAIIATYAFSAAMEGYLEGPLNIYIRYILIIAGLALTWTGMSIYIRLIAVVVFFLLFAFSRSNAKDVTHNQQ